MSKLINQRLDAAQKIIDKSTSSEDSLNQHTMKKDALADQQATEELRQALQIIFARPNRDNMVSKLIPDVRRQLKNFNSYDDTINSLLTEALQGVQSKTFSITDRSTYLFIIENIMDEIRPQVSRSSRYHKMYTDIKNAQLIIPEDVNKDRRKRMFKKFNPSEVAKRRLAHIKRKKSK